MSHDDLIPTLDLGPLLAGVPGSATILAQQLRWASENVGFYSIANHGIPQSLIDAVFRETARFHALPMQTKLAMRINKDQIGYLPMGGSTIRSSAVNRNTRHDLNEALFIRRERSPDDPDVVAGIPWRGLNQWPVDLPGFRDTVLDYWHRMEALGQALLPLYDIAMDMPSGFFRARFEDAHINLRLSHYPPSLTHDENQYGTAPHTDSGFVTFLPQSTVPGVEIRTTDKRWVPVPHRPGTYVVNTGDILHHWTNGRFLSTAHRANNRSLVDRYAIPFFYHPNTTIMIECLPSCCDARNPPRHPPQTFGQYYA